MAGFLDWWDGVELWLSDLGFVLQTIVVMPVVLALAYGIALALDAAFGQGIRVLERARRGDSGDESRVASLLDSGDERGR